MSIELFLGLAIIVGINELKEWKQSKKFDDLNSKLDKIAVELEELKKMIPQLREIKEDLAQTKQNLHELKEAALESKAGIDTILREYELNGVPMGYIRGKHDVIEGL